MSLNHMLQDMSVKLHLLQCTSLQSTSIVLS